MGSKNPWVDWAQFFVAGVHDVITPFKFGDDQLMGFWLAEGQSLPFPIDFENHPYNTNTIVWGVITQYFALYARLLYNNQVTHKKIANATDRCVRYTWFMFEKVNNTINWE